MKENTEKVVVIFDRIDKTAITVIESLGGEIQKQESVEDEQHPLIGKWVKFVDGGKGGYFTNGKWYQCIGDVEKLGAFICNEGERDGFYPHNDEYFNLTDARDYNPDEVKALVGKLVKHKQSGEYHLFMEDHSDSCEVEGVAIQELTTSRMHIYEKTGDQYIMYNSYDLKDFKEKEVELLVPDSVKFYMWCGQITLQVSYGIGLTKDIHEDSFLLCGIKEAEELTPIKCKLVPVKYEDVQVGDFILDESAPKGSIASYVMKHGEGKYCVAREDGEFCFNQTWLSSGAIEFLKVVRC